MNEIEKLYENAGVEKEFEKPAECVKNPYITCDGCMLYDDKRGQCNNKKDYPPFTAEKQIAIFKMFCRRYLEVSQHVEENGDLCFGIKATVGDYAVGFNKDFAECLANFVNCLWQDLTEEEKEQIRNILAR